MRVYVLACVRAHVCTRGHVCAICMRWKLQIAVVKAEQQHLMQTDQARAELTANMQRHFENNTKEVLKKLWTIMFPWFSATGSQTQLPEGVR